MCYSVNWVNVVPCSHTFLFCRCVAAHSARMTPLATTRFLRRRSNLSCSFFQHFISVGDQFSLGFRCTASPDLRKTTFGPRVYSLHRIAGFQLPPSEADALQNPSRALQTGGKGEAEHRRDRRGLMIGGRDNTWLEALSILTLVLSYMWKRHRCLLAVRTVGMFAIGH